MNLLLGDDNLRTYDYPMGPNNNSSMAPNFSNISSRVARQSSLTTYTSTASPIMAIGGGIGGAIYLDSTSGRESPRILSHSTSMGGFLPQQGSGQGSASASSTGGASISRSWRKGLLAEYGNAQEREAAALQRFREVSRRYCSQNVIFELHCIW